MSNPITSILSSRRFRLTKILRRGSIGATSNVRSRRFGRSARLRSKSLVRSMCCNDYTAGRMDTLSQAARGAAAGLPGGVVEALVETRRDLHRHPELGFQEVRTAGIVAARLRALGLSPKEGIAKTGVTAVLEGGGGSGPTLLV